MNPALSLRLAATTLAITALAGTACATSGTSALSTGNAPVATVPAAATAADPAPICAKGAPIDGATSGAKVIRSRGVGWVYQQTLPATYDGATPVALVVRLGDAAISKAAGRSIEKGAIVLDVAGPSNGSAWSGAASELRFLKDLVLRAETSLCFDRSAVYVSGSADAEAADQAVREVTSHAVGTF